MSMIARFVRITSAQLNDLLKDPSAVRSLFREKDQSRSAAVLGQSPMSEASQQRTLQQVSGMLKAKLDQTSPAMREAIAARLKLRGIDIDAAGEKSLADQLIKLAQGGPASVVALAAAMRSAARASAQESSYVSSFSLEKEWHGVHYLLCGQLEAGSSWLSRAIMGGVEIGDDEFGYGPARYFNAVDAAKIAVEIGDANLETRMRARFDPAAMTQAGIYPGGWISDDVDSLFGAFGRLRDFYVEAKDKGLAVITCIV